jgi:hypothetical protein
MENKSIAVDAAAAPPSHPANIGNGDFIVLSNVPDDLPLAAARVECNGGQ